MAKEPEKHPGGRPTKYDPDMLKQAKKLVMMGANDKQIADFFEVHISNFKRWKVKYPEFRALLDQTKQEYNAKIVTSLYRRAMGYSHKAVKIIYDPKKAEAANLAYLQECAKYDDPGEAAIMVTPPDPEAGVVKVEYTERYAPDTNAIKFYLTNRQPDQWKEKNQTELSGPDGTPIQMQGLDNLTFEQLMALKYGGNEKAPKSED